MATPESDASDSQARHTLMEKPREQVIGSSGLSSGATIVDTNGSVSDKKSGLPADSTSFHSHVHDAQPSVWDERILANASSPSSQYSPALIGSGESSSPSSKQFTEEGGPPKSPSKRFTFARPDRGKSEIGHIQHDEVCAAAQESNSSPKHSPVILADDTHPVEYTVESIAYSVVAEENNPGQDHARRDRSSTGATPFGSDDFPEAGANPAACRSEASVSHQINEQISQETLGSELSEHFTSAAARSGDVIYMRAGPSEAPQTALHASDIGGRTLETSQPFPHSSSITRNKLSPGSFNNGNETLQPPGKTSTQNMFAGGPGSRPIFQTNVSSRGHANRPVPTPGNIQELLEVVEYKFKQNEQQLRQAYTNDSAQIQYELQQAYEENEELRSQVSALDERCNRSEGAINKYRNQILKAKGLQKFLDGLGVDLHSLKRSYDQEKDNFARRIEASETEIKRLESTLRGKDQFEGMLSHSKTLLEKLLEARGLELQSLVQHRDLLRNQLDERIGQLVEERDNRMRLEQLVLELRSNERSSVTSSIEQCVASLVPKLADLGRQDDRLAISIANVQMAIDSFTQRPMICPDDCDAIKAAVHDLGLRMAQTLSRESSNNLTVAEVCSSVEGIMQSHARAMHRGLDRLETVLKQRADQGSTEAASQIELQHAKALLERVDSQLGTSMQREKSLSDEVAQAKARISELEGALSSATTPSLNEMPSAEVEKKVGEAVANTRREMSDNARTFIAQEKAKFANEMKKVTNEHRKAAETAVAYQEKIDRLENELLEMQSLLSDANGRRGAHQQQEIDPDLDAKLAEGEVAKASIIDRDHKIAELTQIIEQCNIDLLHARSMSEQAREQVEEMRRQRESDIDDLCQQLSQAEEKSSAAEAGIAQTKSDAEQNFFTEQEKHRKRVESLQQRIDQAQSELQMRSEEADESQAFMKRNLIHQQEFWEKSNAELEAKASRFQIMLEEERQVLERMRKGQDDLRATISGLEAEKAKHQQQQVDYNVREDANQVIIEDLKTQLNASQIEITNLHAVQQRYLREKDERSSREAKARSTSDDLRKELDAAKAKIADLRAPKEHKDSSQVHDNVLGTGLTQDERMGHESTHLMLGRSKNMRNEVLQPHVEDVEDGREPFLLPKQQRRLAVIVPNAELQHPGRPKQRRKADRSTNTVVNSGVESQYTQADATPTQDQSHTIHEPDFMIYEDPQDSSNQDFDVESIAHTNKSTFHKPRPIPNIGSKRLTSTTSDKSSQGCGTQRTPENSFGQFSSQVYKTPDAPNYPFGSSPEFMNPSNTKTKRRYSGNSNGTPKDVHSPATQHPETLIPDPRIAARTHVSKRMPAKRGQQDGMLEPPTKRKHTASTATQPNGDRMSDNTFLGRSSQSINSLPRIEDLNVGRSSQHSSSNMRSSAAPRRITRSQKSTKGDAYGARFNQELQR